MIMFLGCTDGGECKSPNKALADEQTLSPPVFQYGTKNDLDLESIEGDHVLNVTQCARAQLPIE